MKYVYESPDGGETVYRRKFGTPERELYSVSQKKQDQAQLEKEWSTWKDILSTSQNNLALKQALDQARIIYELSRCD
jgi:hypothetical protein